MNIRANENRPPLMLVSITTPNYRTKTKRRRNNTICFRYPSGYPPSLQKSKVLYPSGKEARLHTKQSAQTLESTRATP